MENEKRKVNLVGQKTLTVSLPSNFVKRNRIEKGDNLYVYYNKEQITFSMIEKKVLEKEIEFNIDDFSYFSLSRYLSMLYVANYNKITLKYTKNKILYNKTSEMVHLDGIVKKIVRRFVGAEIMTSTDKKTEIECFVTHDTQDLEKIEKRIYFLFKEMTKDLLGSIGPEFSEYHDKVYEYHDNIDKFVYYFLRKLDFSEKTEEEKKIAYTFYKFITILVDKIRHTSEKINEYGCSEKLKNYLTELFDLFFEMYMEYIHKGNILQAIVTKRYNLVDKMNGEKFDIKELQVITEIKIFLQMINIFEEYSIIKSLRKEKEPNYQ